METKLTIDLAKKMKIGDQITIRGFVAGQRDVLSLSSSEPSPRYSMIRGEQHIRMINDNGERKEICATDEGCNGTELIQSFTFLGVYGDSLMFDEDNFNETVDGFDIKLIDSKHPSYNKKLEQSAKQFNSMIKSFLRKALS